MRWVTSGPWPSSGVPITDAIPSPSADGVSPAYARFLDSLGLNHERWHDGTGIDLAAIEAMTPAERQAAFTLLRGRPQTWRETEALAHLARRGVADTADWLDALQRQADDAYLSADARLTALSALNDLGHVPDFDRRLAAQIRRLTDSGPGLTRALLLAEQHPTEAVQQALLWATWNRTACAPFCAGLVCYLAGAAAGPFDFARRDLFLRFDPHASYFERQEAFAELLRLTGLAFRPDQD